MILENNVLFSNVVAGNVKRTLLVARCAGLS